MRSGPGATTDGVAGFVIDSDPARLDAEQVHRWLSEQAYWALGRTRECQDRANASSRVFGVYPARSPAQSTGGVEPDGTAGGQVAFARAVTDGATFAWVCDVFVDAAVRGRGIGGWLVGHVVDALEGEGVLRVVLATRDAHEVYARIGFDPLANPSTWMERDRRPQRPAPGQFG